MTRLLPILLCLALAGCHVAETKPAIREAIDCPAPKPPPEKRMSPFWPKRTLRAAFV